MNALMIVMALVGIAEEKIPLETIWALNMPGTRNVRELEPENFGKAGSGVDSNLNIILQPLRGLRTGQAKPAFAVLGTGLDALEEARAVMKGLNARSSFPKGSDISIVFFTHPSALYVHVHEVVKSSGLVQVRYRLVPHETKELTQHFALIPLGKLPSGRVKVEVSQSPMEQKFVDAGAQPPEKGWESRTISGSFEFVVD